MSEVTQEEYEKILGIIAEHEKAVNQSREWKRVMTQFAESIGSQVHQSSVPHEFFMGNATLRYLNGKYNLLLSIGRCQVFRYGKKKLLRRVRIFGLTLPEVCQFYSFYHLNPVGYDILDGYGVIKVAN